MIDGFHRLTKLREYSSVDFDRATAARIPAAVVRSHAGIVTISWSMQATRTGGMASTSSSQIQETSTVADRRRSACKGCRVGMQKIVVGCRR